MHCYSVVCITGYRIFGALSKCKYIAQIAPVGWNVSAVVEVSFRALNATHSATGSVGRRQGP